MTIDDIMENLDCRHTLTSPFAKECTKTAFLASLCAIYILHVSIYFYYKICHERQSQHEYS